MVLSRRNLNSSTSFESLRLLLQTCTDVIDQVCFRLRSFQQDLLLVEGPKAFPLLCCSPSSFPNISCSPLVLCATEGAAACLSAWTSGAFGSLCLVLCRLAISGRVKAIFWSDNSSFFINSANLAHVRLCTQLTLFSLFEQNWYPGTGISWYTVESDLEWEKYIEYDKFGMGPNATVWEEYLISFYWVSSTLTSSGWNYFNIFYVIWFPAYALRCVSFRMVGDVVPQNPVEIIFCIVLMILNLTLYRWASLGIPASSSVSIWQTLDTGIRDNILSCFENHRTKRLVRQNQPINLLTLQFTFGHSLTSGMSLEKCPLLLWKLTQKPWKNVHAWRLLKSSCRCKSQAMRSAKLLSFLWTAVLFPRNLSQDSRISQDLRMEVKQHFLASRAGPSMEMSVLFRSVCFKYTRFKQLESVLSMSSNFMLYLVFSF